MRWAHSAVDYLAAAVGGDRVRGGIVVQEKGTVHGQVEGESPLSWEEYLVALVCLSRHLDLLMCGRGGKLGKDGERSQKSVLL